MYMYTVQESYNTTHVGIQVAVLELYLGRSQSSDVDIREGLAELSEDVHEWQSGTDTLEEEGERVSGQ